MHHHTKFPTLFAVHLKQEGKGRVSKQLRIEDTKIAEDGNAKRDGPAIHPHTSGAFQNRSVKGITKNKIWHGEVHTMLWAGSD